MVELCRRGNLLLVAKIEKKFPDIREQTAYALPRNEIKSESKVNSTGKKMNEWQWEDEREEGKKAREYLSVPATFYLTTWTTMETTIDQLLLPAWR